jgi:hypothetical protein
VPGVVAKDLELLTAKYVAISRGRALIRTLNARVCGLFYLFCGSTLGGTQCRSDAKNTVDEITQHEFANMILSDFGELGRQKATTLRPVVGLTFANYLIMAKRLVTATAFISLIMSLPLLAHHADAKRSTATTSASRVQRAMSMTSHVDTVKPRIKRASAAGKRHVKAAALMRNGQRFEQSANASVVIYLNPYGPVLTAGFDDPANNVSSIAASAGPRLSVPAFAGGAKKWNRIMACVADKYRDFSITFTDKQPSSGDYNMIVVGGTAGMLGMSDAVAGIAPSDGTVLHNAVGFAFSQGNEDVESLCNTVVHETGHTLGLDHSMRCEDPMSYQSGCGEKYFAASEEHCGEYDARACSDGSATQNSYNKLARFLGLRAGKVETNPSVTDLPTVPAPMDPVAVETDQGGTLDPYFDDADSDVVDDNSFVTEVFEVVDGDVETGMEQEWSDSSSPESHDSSEGCPQSANY